MSFLDLEGKVIDCCEIPIAFCQMFNLDHDGPPHSLYFTRTCAAETIVIIKSHPEMRLKNPIPQTKKEAFFQKASFFKRKAELPKNSYARSDSLPKFSLDAV
ncbi:hypothetical protein Ruko_34760 [Ruthenibacterium sp. TH_2024_36131]